MNVGVAGGAGYVGLITGLGLAEIGHHVVNVDLDADRIRMLQKGESPIYEDDIEPLLRRNLDAGRLRFSTDLHSAISDSEVVFIAVGTPSLDDGQADLSQVIQVAEEMVRYVDTYKVIVVKSTVPVGTVALVLSILRREKEEGTHFDMVSNPEFLREGKGLADFFHPDRIVIGASSERAIGIMRAVYEPIILRAEHKGEDSATPKTMDQVPVVETDLASAEMIKYASNAFLAARISFINEIGGLCEKVGADIKDVVQGMGYDPRIGHPYLEAGLGFGGPCLEKDLRAIIKISEGAGYDPRLLRAVLERNERQVGEVVSKLKQLIGYLLYRKTVAAFGLTFKAGTNDVRNSLALKVIDRLEEEGAIVQAHDPVGVADALAMRPALRCHRDPYEAVRNAEALLVLTEWPSFGELDYKRIKAEMAAPRIVDARNLLDPGTMRDLGFSYIGIGRQ